MTSKKRSHEECDSEPPQQQQQEEGANPYKFPTPEPEDIDISNDELQSYIHRQSRKLSNFINILNSLRGFMMPFIYKINEEFNQILLFNSFDNLELYKLLRMLFVHFNLFYSQGLMLQKIEYQEEDELFKFVRKDLSWEENVMIIEFIIEAKKNGLTLLDIE
ncbi:hypothetical protein WICPIJ_010115 [Wickerhamomyces pijperi]|uniref:Uncharacterized protein n=1 Tax=Wickerhamomyces pijperi TaxID=599730 RepID=A0A9P8PIK3_WICPI|nr:hypothetical protein WICPIJ_010115 [Wickerhamomyces pijperi]